MKRGVAAFLIAVLAFSIGLTLSACNSNGAVPANLPTPDSAQGDNQVDNENETINQEDEVLAAEVEHSEQNMEEEDYLDGTIAEHIRENPVQMLQLMPLTPGEELVVLHTNHGDITLRLFPDEAPVAVENFTTHARDGFYDGVIFHRVIPNFMIQGGDPTGTGTGGESIWGSPFGLEPSFNLRHFRGALAMAHAGGAMGSQFYIVQNPTLPPEYEMSFQDILDTHDELFGVFSDGYRFYQGHVHVREAYEHFLEYGGTPHLDWIYGNPQGHTVFGHVVEGMDVVDAIALTEAVSSRPVEDVVIERVSFIIYE